MLNKLFSNAYSRMRYLRFSDMRPFLTKVLNVSMSFLMIFTLAFVTIEVADPEPAFANSQLSCFNSDGNPLGYQTKYNSSSDKVEVYGWDSNSGNLVSSSPSTPSGATFEYQNLPGSSSNEWNNSMMDNLGNLWMIRKDGSKNRSLYYMDATDADSDNIADNNPALIDSWGSADNNAASYFEYNGTGYLLSGNGFLKGSSPLLIRIDGTNYTSSSNYTDVTNSLTVNTNSLAGNLAKAKDFTWLRDGSNFPTFSSGGVNHEADFVAYDNVNDQVMLGYLIVSGSSFTIEITDHSLSSPSNPYSWSNSDVGAAFGFGGDHAYFVHNSTGDVRKAEYNGSSWSWSSSLGTVQSGANKNDGAACHEGAPNVDFAPTVTATQGSCDGSNREIDVTLNNSSSNVATNFVVTYTVNGGGAQSLTSGTSVSSSSNNTSLSVPGQANGAAVVISWYAENTANNLRKPNTGTTALS